MPRVPAVVVYLLLASYTAVLQGQSTNASLTGRITDPSKALIVGAKVVAVSSATNLRYETASNGSGEFYLPNLPPNLYRIEVEKTGFAKLIKPDVFLHVQDALEINFEMKVGSASDSITVQGGAPLVNTESATVSTIVDRTFVDNLPLNGRSFQTLIELTPGVVVTQTAFDDQGQFSVNGQRANGNYFTVDGVSANFGVTGYFPMVQSAGGSLPALSVSGGTNSLVSVDAMQEFRIQTSSFAPEFGRTPGGQISIATRSGTNVFHGALFEYFRNDVLDAKDWFANFNQLPKPEERQNDFGGVFSGPIFKDKTFFFFSYEGLRLRQPSTAESVVPDMASRLQAPATMQPFLNAYFVPNGPPAGPGLAQFNASFSSPSSLDAYSIRVDHVVNSKLHLFGRYNYSPSNFTVRGRLPAPLKVLSETEPLDSSVHTFTIGLTEMITPGISNEVRANYSNQRVSTKFVMDNFGGAVPLPDSLLFPPGFSSANSNFSVDIAGAGEYAQGKEATDEQRQFNLVDNLSVTKGSHQLKFGLDYRWLSPFSSPFRYSQFALFSGVTCPPPPSSCAGFALSGTAAFDSTASQQSDALWSQNFSFYGQDTWKVTPRFTLTYGLRWDINPPLKGKNRANDPFTILSLNDPATMTLAPRGTPLYQTTYGNVAPRVGVAYQLGRNLKWSSVVRSGFGIFYDLGTGSLGGVSTYFPYQAQNFFASVPFPLSSQNAAPPALTTNPPVSTIFAVDPHLKLPRTYQWNAALEQSLGSSQSLSFTYIGGIGRKLLRGTSLFIDPRVNPDFSFILLTDSSATSDYHALQLKFERRFSRGLQALASYTYFHSIDIASTDAFSNATNDFLNTPSALAGAQIDRGNSDFDIRHSFTAGVTYEVPNPLSSGIGHVLLSGWLLDSFILARSSPPDNVAARLFFTEGVALNPRPDVTPGIPLYLYGPAYPGGKIINNTPGAAGLCPANGLPSVGPFCPPAPTPLGNPRQGNFPRNVLRGFGAAQWDFGVHRSFPLREAWHLEFRGEFFNILNHPNFGNPVGDLTSPFFGQSTQTLANSLGSGGANGGFNPLYQIGGPRSIQLALKLQF
jgi:hypothetical protein